MRVRVLIVFVFLTATPAIAHAQDFDPTRQILPFTRELQLMGDGDYTEAMDGLAETSTAVQLAIAKLYINWGSVNRRDPRLHLRHRRRIGHGRVVAAPFER